MDLTQKQFASMGGKAILKKRGKEYFRELAFKSAAARKAKKSKAKLI
jgi:hypothetical protein